MKIGFFNIESWEKETLEKSFPTDEIIFSEPYLSLDNITGFKDLEVISGFVNSKLNKDALEKLPHLKLIATRSTGFDHIDLEECKKRKITVCNVPNYGENTVAEFTFALILALSRKLITSVGHVGGELRCESLRGFDLNGKTLGVIGCGAIGRHVVRVAKGFEMKILVFDIVKDESFAKKMGFKYVDLDDLLKNADVVTLHLPLNEHTYHLIDKDKLALMKKSALLINTSRGKIIDTKALLESLQDEKLLGVALDVFESDYKQDLLESFNVLITPHNAFNTQEALNRILETTIKNIKMFRESKSVNVVV